MLDCQTGPTCQSLIPTCQILIPHPFAFKPAEFAKVVSQRFSCSVSSTSPGSPAAFRVVASFGPSALCLNEDSVGLILQSCLGGNAKDFRVHHLSGWMFAFSVSCRKVGFMVHKLKSFSCKTFAIFFFFWSDGGPNWQKEFIFGVLNWRLNGQRLDPNLKKVLQMLYVHLLFQKNLSFCA